MELCYQHNSTFVYSNSDWEKLRKEYRIVGETSQLACNTPGLPLALLPEEVVLLVNKNVAKLVQYPELENAPTENDEHQMDDLKKRLLKEETNVYKIARRQQLEKMIDKIVEKKNKRKSNEQTPSREEVLEEELNKFEINESNMIWPIFKEEILHKGKPVDVPLKEVLKLTTTIRCAVYADLWEKGFFITSGNKFGGDFLAYLGDPIVYHAIYIIRCVTEVDEKLHPNEIIAFGRLGTSVKKRAVLASLNENGIVTYITLNWLDR